MTELPFTKMHGLGNCFILMDDRDEQITGRAKLDELAKKVCDREFGIGADGLILICNPTEDGATAMDRATQVSPLLRMRIFNEDGSEPEMCGNGVRCFARYVVDKGITDHRVLNIETLAGIIRTSLCNDDQVEVDMGEPALRGDDIRSFGDPPLSVHEFGYEFFFVSMGNPHAITFVDDFEFNWRKTGASVEVSSSFHNKTNVEFVRSINADTVDVKVWERGCGETLACGTGACAVAVAGALTGRLPRAPVKVNLPGGPLTIHWNKQNRVMMTGPAVTVCDGVFFS